MRAGLFVALLVAGTTPGWAGPADMTTWPASAAKFPDQGFNHPIDLGSGFHGLAPPPTDEPIFVRERDEGLTVQPDLPGRLPGLPRGLGGIANKRQHAAMFRLNGVKLFGGDVAGGIDGRSAHIMLSWPTNF